MPSERVGEYAKIYVRGGRWHVNLQFAGRQIRKSLQTTSKKQAITAALRLERELVAGKQFDDQRPVAVGEAIELFMASRRSLKRAAKTLTKYDYCFQLLKELAAKRAVKRLSQVDIRFMDAYQAMRVAGGAEPKTVRNDLVQIRGLINFALKRKQLREDPLAGYTFEKPKSRVQPYWPADQLVKILRAATRRPHADVFRLLAETGMRIGEVRHLTWSDIDLENQVLHIRAKADWCPKTGDERIIPIAPEVATMLAAQPKRLEAVFTFAADRLYPDRPISERRMLDYLKRVLKKLGLKGHLHTFRHTHISLALTRGVPEAVLRRWIGHVDRHTLDHYTHIASSEARSAIHGLSQIIRGATESS